MGKTQRRRGNTSRNKQYGRARKAKKHERMLDQIILEDMLPVNTELLKNQKIDEEVTGLAQHYCVTCVRHFISDKALKEHYQNKEHKKRLKICLKGDPYTIEESERAAGLMPAVTKQK
jgi:bud site selection protein 20